MKTILTALVFISLCGSSVKETTNIQPRWVEQWIAMGSSEPRLGEAWLEDSQKNKIERRTIDYNGKTREDWMTLAKIEYNGKEIAKTEMYSKQFENGEKPNMTIVVDFDKNSRKTKSNIYYHVGTNSKDPVMFTTYTYDSNSNLITETTTSLVDYFGKPTEPEVSTIEYRYKDTLLIEEWKVAKGSSKFEHYSYKYDANGNMVEKKLLDEIDYLEKQLFTFKYDGSGKMIEDNTFFNSGKIFRRHKFIYNEAGDLIKQLEYGDETDNPIVTVTYKYEVINDKKKNAR